MKMKKNIQVLKNKMLKEKRYVSIEQSRIVTRIYQQNEHLSTSIKRALAFKACCEELQISVDPLELIVGNRCVGVRSGIVFVESGSKWIKEEFVDIPNRPQDKFNIRLEDVKIFNEELFPYWENKSLESKIYSRYGKEIKKIEKVVKINQKDHAQGHIIPNIQKWLKLGLSGIEKEIKEALLIHQNSEYLQASLIVLEGSKIFINRYACLLEEQASNEQMIKVSKICHKLVNDAPTSFHEAVQFTWFLFVLLHLESNASSFSLGQLDRYLWEYYDNDIKSKLIDKEGALEIIENLWLKFNQIVYLRNSHSAKYFAGFPIGFNIVIGGKDLNEQALENELSYLFLQATKELLLPQPNLSVRLNKQTSDQLVNESIKVVAKGSGMPQYFNDEAIIDELINLGISKEDAYNYGVVGCVEITTVGNNLGFSDAAMFNFNKVLELTLNNGKCLLTGEQIGLDLGNITNYQTYEQLEDAFKKQLDYFMVKMIDCLVDVEKTHQEVLPSAFLSLTIDDCIKNNLDVTRGGARYNFSGIQMIQIANLSDSLCALKKLVFEEQLIKPIDLLQALKNDFNGYEILQLQLLNKAPKYGNNIDEVDLLGIKWASYFRKQLDIYQNYRNGRYHTGMYTVSAHVPMGENLGASCDGRNALKPLADGGMSCVYGKDKMGPTALLQSVSKIPCNLTTNGGLLNMKFLPQFFKDDESISKFNLFLRSLVKLQIPHIQFNVVNKEDLINAKREPEKYATLTIRVAGYTAYFVELASELQDEIIERTGYSSL
ncbi:MAG: formate C-acetyltransferase/glycerol dehydratase family glycyl radical enzyme [Erysipelotrichaceae bacterium]